MYAFGVLLWELVTGCPAWEGLSNAQLAYVVLVDNQALEIPKDAPSRLKALLTNVLGEAELRVPFSDIVEVVEGCIMAL